MRDNVTLVCGLPGTGKSTYVKEHLGEGLVYDLDALAGALRACGPHEERHDGARRTADLMLMPFLTVARELSPKVFVIRTAPSLSEVRQIHPAGVVVCTKQFVKRPFEGYVKQRLRDLVAYCEDTGTPLQYTSDDREGLK